MDSHQRTGTSLLHSYQTCRSRRRHESHGETQGNGDEAYGAHTKISNKIRAPLILRVTHATPCPYDETMQNEYTAVVRQDGPWWIGWIEEIPGVNSQGASREELMESLQSALTEILEMNRDEARKAAGDDFEEVRISA